MLKHVGRPPPGSAISRVLARLGVARCRSRLCGSGSWAVVLYGASGLAYRDGSVALHDPSGLVDGVHGAGRAAVVMACQRTRAALAHGRSWRVNEVGR